MGYTHRQESGVRWACPSEADRLTNDDTSGEVGSRWDIPIGARPRREGSYKITPRRGQDRMII